MKSESLVHQHLPTPPMNSTDPSLGLSHIAHFNANSDYSFSEGSHSSPVPMSHPGHPVHPGRADSHSGGVLGLGIHYDYYAPATKYLHDGPNQGIQNNQGSFSPPTPHSTIDEDSVQKTTLPGRNILPATPPLKNAPSPAPNVPTRIIKTPRTRKPKAGKMDKSRAPKLPAPLSLLGGDIKHIPVRDMGEWVHRTSETRIMEAEKKKGYIPRPMNSFMLYRSAYSDKAKAWCLQNNHQVVSTVAGESWPLEPEEIRALYNEYARVERINHQNAHPSYKFSPSKTAAPARKRKNEWSDGEPSDLDDFEWAPGSGRSRPQKERRIERSLSYPNNGFTTEFFEPRYEANPPGMDPSLWDMPNGARPVAVSMAQSDPYSPYFPSYGYPAMPVNSSYAENARTRSMGTPASASFQSENDVLGLPGTNAGELMQSYPSHGNTPSVGVQLDPMLLAYVSDRPDRLPLTLQDGYQIVSTGADKPPLHDLDNLLGTWHSDPILSTLDHDSEFEQWMRGGGS